MDSEAENYRGVFDSRLDTAVEAMRHGFRAVVPRDCVGDRAPEPHDANLFDTQAKHGEVMPVADVIARLRATVIQGARA